MPPELDLHGTRHDDVPAEVHNFIWKNRKYKDAFIIITGASLIMKKRVLEVLKLYCTKKIQDRDGANWGRIKFWLDN